MAWPKVKLADVVDLIRNSVDPRGTPSARYVGMDQLQPGNPRLANFGSAKDLLSAKSQFLSNDVLYGKLRPYLDKAVLAEWEGVASTELLVLRSRDQILPAYLAYLLHTSEFISYAVSTTSGVNHPRTSWADLKKFEFALPPLTEQHAIANLLSTIQRTMEGETSAQAAMTRLRQSLIETSFDGRKPAAHLKDVLREPLRNGYSPREAPEGLVRVFTLSAVTQRDFSLRNTKTCVPERPIDGLWACPGDIFIERANTRELVGMAALYGGKEQFAFFPDLLVRVRVDEGQVLAKVMDAFLSTQSARRYFQTNARGTAGNMPKIDHGIIGNLDVPLLSSEEQDRLVVRLNAIDRAIDASQRRLNGLRGLWRTALTDLLSGKRRART